jgi:hypothetical protein
MICATIKGARGGAKQNAVNLHKIGRGVTANCKVAKKLRICAQISLRPAHWQHLRTAIENI